MKAIGLDWGEKRIGVAVSDAAGIIAMPLCTIDVVSEKKVLEKLGDIIDDKEAECIVVGMPVNMNGTMGPMSRKVDAFIAKLEKKFDVPVIRVDERMSSLSADRSLKESKMDGRQRKAVRDKVAAQVILQGYLDSTTDYDELLNRAFSE